MFKKKQQILEQYFQKIYFIPVDGVMYSYRFLFNDKQIYSLKIRRVDKTEFVCSLPPLSTIPSSGLNYYKKEVPEQIIEAVRADMPIWNQETKWKYSCFYSFTKNFIYLFGKKHVLRVLNGSRFKVEFFNNVVYVHKTNKTSYKEILETIYQQLVGKYFIQRLNYWAKKMNVKYGEYVFFWKTYYGREYGSCEWNEDGKVLLRFNYECLSMNKKSIDSILIHELSHITHFHHRKSFWDYVKKYDAHLNDWDNFFKCW